MRPCDWPGKRSPPNRTAPFTATRSPRSCSCGAMSSQALQIETACLIDDPGDWQLHQQVERFSRGD